MEGNYMDDRINNIVADILNKRVLIEDLIISDLIQVVKCLIHEYKNTDDELRKELIIQTGLLEELDNI